MKNPNTWIAARVRLGWAALAAGVLVAAIGILLSLKFSNLPYNYRIITGLGILLIAVGVGTVVRYAAALKDERAALRVTVEEKDERTVMIRARAGSRAYWVSAALVYIGLLWSSFAANGALPELGGDTLWYFLAAGVIIPFGVYVASIVRDEQRT